MRYEKGFTLIELMIVVVVLGIIAAIAYPAYSQYVQQTRRADATSTLLNAAQQLERCFTRFDSYSAAGCPTAWATEGGFYQIDASDIEAERFRLVATPLPPQDRDVNCLVFALDQRGNRTPNPDPNRCWRR